MLLTWLVAFTLAHGAVPKLPSNALPVPITLQATDYSCGAASLLSILLYWQAYDGTESSLYPLLETTEEQGTEPNKIAEVARALGLNAAYREGVTIAELRAALSRGETVILALQAWRDPKSRIPWSETWEDGHYAVLVALDAEYAYFMDSAAGPGYTYVPIPELLERWHDYENRRGRLWRYFQLGIFISGKNPLRGYPSQLIRMD